MNVLNLSGFINKCPENPDKTTRTDTRARIGNPDIVRCPVPVRFALSVSGLRPVDKGLPVEIHGTACRLVRSGGGYAVMHDEKLVAQAETRFLVVARAAACLAPARAFGGTR